MVSSIKRQLQPKTFYEKPLNKSKGILDDYAIRKAINTREGSITKTPVRDYDIVNKKYVDDTHVPAGSDTEIQFNDSGAFGASSNFYWDNSLNKLFVREGTTNSDVIRLVANTTYVDLGVTTVTGQLRVKGPTKGGIVVRGGATQALFCQIEAGQDHLQIINLAAYHLYLFEDSSNNKNKQFRIYGRPDGETKKYGQLQIISGEKFQISSDSGEIDFDDDNLGTTGTITGGGAKCQMTPIGGYAVLLTNKTGVNTIAGQIVKADTATNDAVILTAADEMESFGVFLDSGIADGSEAWVVINGIGDIAMEDNTAATRGNWVRTSITEIGYADATNAAAPGLILTHFAEIGHCIESVAAGGVGTHILARCVLHFN